MAFGWFRRRRRQPNPELDRIRELEAQVARLRARRDELRTAGSAHDLAAVEDELAIVNERLVQLTDLRGFDKL